MSVPAKHIPIYNLTGSTVIEETVFMGWISDKELDFYHELIRRYQRDEAKRIIKNKNQRYKYWTNKMKNEK